MRGDISSVRHLRKQIEQNMAGTPYCVATEGLRYDKTAE
jgi:hypothetical protein